MRIHISLAPLSLPPTMAAIPLSRVSALLLSLAIHFAPPTSSRFSLPPGASLLPGWDIDGGTEFLGDAAISSDGSSVHITRPSPSSSGLAVRCTPLRLSPPTSFSTDFTFSISPGAGGDGLALVLFPKDSAPAFVPSSFGLSRKHKGFVGVEFDTSMDEDVGDMNANHVGINLGSFVSASVSNVSSMNIVLNSGEKLQSWVDYDASSKRLEVRLSRFGEPRPYNPVVAHLVDFSEMWSGENELLFGFSSSNRKSVQTTTVYSWSFKSRGVPSLMHSMPVDPNAYNKGDRHTGENKKRGCSVAFVGGLVLMALLGALLVSLVSSLWAMVVEACRVDSPERRVDFRYVKVGVAGGDGGGDCHK